MRVSVITVCLNAEETIEDTIKSVIHQKYHELEYLIIDGQSTDKTLDIVSRYREVPFIKVISQKDTGLYNAMNYGVKQCKGDYIVFLNSGDVFVDENVLMHVMEHARGEFVYGNVIRKYKGKMILEKYAGRQNLFWLMLIGKMPCHQAIFVKRELMSNYMFDETFTICADFDLFVRVLKNKVYTQYVNITVSKVDCVNGISSQQSNIDIMRKEDDRSILKNFPILYICVYIPKWFVRMLKHGN